MGRPRRPATERGELIAAPGRVFLSYRRDGTAAEAHALFRDLVDAFGVDRVFLDTALSGGAVWPDRLQQEVGAAPVVLVVVGRDWLATDEWNKRRIDVESDWVRKEIETALADPGKLIVPVLLDGARMPPTHALPPSLAGLADRQARTLNHETWPAQRDRLIADIAAHTGWRSRAGSAASSEPAVRQYVTSQLRRAETALRIGRMTLGPDRRDRADDLTTLVVPDLVPFQAEEPALDRLTASVARHVRRAAKDRARYSAREILADSRSRRVVVLGGPGSGKTTLLNMLTRSRAAAGLDDPTVGAPVLLRVRDMALDGGGVISEAANDAGRRLDLRLDRDFFDDLFASGRGLLIVDGVDEAPDVRERTELLATIDLFAERYPDATILVSSRVVGYDPRVLGGRFDHYELAPFSSDQTRQFLAAALDPRATAGRSGSLDVESVARRIVDDPRLSALAESPLLLSIIARIMIERGTVDRMPRERAALYDAAVRLMLADWDAQRGVRTAERPGRLELDDIRQALETVAYRVHAGLAQRGSTSIVDSTTLEYELTTALELLGSVSAGHARWAVRDLLRYTVGRAGLLVESGPGRFAFAHRALQEYLAACAVVSRSTGPSGIDPVVEHLDEHGLHQAEWRNVNLLTLSMLRGRRADVVFRHVLDAGSAYEEWLHRDLLFVGEVFGESPALVASIDEELVVRVVDSVVDLGVVNRVEIGYYTSLAVRRVLGSWRDSPLIQSVRRTLDHKDRRAFPVERHCVRAIIGEVASARDALLVLVVSGDVQSAHLASIAMRGLSLEFDLDLASGRSQIEDVLDSIPGRVAALCGAWGDTRLPYTAGELAGLLARGGPVHDEVRSRFLSWINDSSAPAALRGVAATGLGYLEENSLEVRHALIAMLLDRSLSADERDWPAYALRRLGGGEDETVEAMLTILEDEAPNLCLWAQLYLRRFSTRSAQVVDRLRLLAADDSRPTLPWVLQAIAHLAGLTFADVDRLEVIASSDESMIRRAGAIETLVECAELGREWRSYTAGGLVRSLTPLVDQEPTDAVLTDLWAGVGALGSLRRGDSEVWDLCRRLLQHDNPEIRLIATYGISGLPSDVDVSTRLVAALDLPEAVGETRGGLIDALHRVLAPDTPDL